MPKLTHEGTTKVEETKFKMLLHDYEAFQMKEDESITIMLDWFIEITNGLASVGKVIWSSDKVKKILSLFPK